MSLRIALLSVLAALAFALVAAPARADQGVDFSFYANAHHYAPGSAQEALGIFPFQTLTCFAECTPTRGYLVAGYVREAGADRYKPAILVLDDDGAPVANVGLNGWIVDGALLDSINDVAYDAANHRMYFVGTRNLAGTVNVFTVVCVNVDLEGGCPGFGLLGSGVTQRPYEGSDYSSYGERIAFDPDLGLFVSGTARRDSDGEWLGVARLDAGTGEFINAFNGHGSRVYSYQPRMVGNTIRPHAMALSAVPAPDGKRHLYLGGEYRTNPDVHDSFRGFVTAINPVNGNGIGNFGGDNTAWRQITGYAGNQSAVVALNVQANGKLTVLARNEQVYPGGVDRRVQFARLLANGAPDPDFCTQSGIAIGCSSVHGQVWGATTFNRGAIAERPDNRDLVFFFPTDGPVRAYIAQVSANATAHRGVNSLSYPVSLHQPACTATYPGAVAFDWRGTSRMVYAGSCLNSITGLREFAVARTMTDDIIFADTFGGAHSD